MRTDQKTCHPSAEYVKKQIFLRNVLNLIQINSKIVLKATNVENENEYSDDKSLTTTYF